MEEKTRSECRERGTKKERKKERKKKRKIEKDVMITLAFLFLKLLLLTK